MTTLRELYDLLKRGPTSANNSPARFLFLRTPRGEGAAAPGAVGGQHRQDDGRPGHGDRRLRPEILRRICPGCSRTPTPAPGSPSNEELAEATAFRNGTLQGAYLIIAARALGLDCGAMSGFDNAKVDQEFLTDRGWKSNFLVNIGHGDPSGVRPKRSPRFAFDEACLLL